MTHSEKHNVPQKSEVIKISTSDFYNNLKKKKNNQRRQTIVRITSTQLSRRVRKVQVERSVLHRFSFKNHIGRKFSVFENREKFRGEDKSIHYA